MSIRSVKDDIKPTPLNNTVVPLLLAPAPTLVIVSLEHFLTSASPSPLFVAILPIVAAFCYVGELILVVPLFLIWPSLRAPSLPVAGVWGLAVAWIMTFAIYGHLARDLAPSGMMFLSAAGIASGLFYAVLIRRVGRDT